MYVHISGPIVIPTPVPGRSPEFEGAGGVEKEEKEQTEGCRKTIFRGKCLWISTWNVLYLSEGRWRERQHAHAHALREKSNADKKPPISS
jgi:hypothetical protein